MDDYANLDKLLDSEEFNAYMDSLKYVPTTEDIKEVLGNIVRYPDYDYLIKYQIK